jgi:hypothetical protein
MDRQGMDHYSILDRSSAPPGVEGAMPGSGASRSATASVSAGIAAANAHLPNPSEPGPRFPGEDGGRSLAEMAHSDLDAALQLLVERAQYITGASGAAIALRRSQNNDMLCRASTGSNAPELGALLSMEFGLSGESVRTRQALRCDDAERDPRVNREGCREMGIASLVVMPIVSEEQVLGVFELFSGKPRAFEERDLSALQRLSEMVETAVKHAVAMQTVPAAREPAGVESQPSLESAVSVMVPGLAPAMPVKNAPSQELKKPDLERMEAEKTEPAQTKSVPAPKKPLFWSAAMQTQAAARAEGTTESIAVPPVLRNLRKCQACGFPVSQGRSFCVECEERQWRGQRLQRPAAGAASGQAQARATKPAPIKPAAIAAQTSAASSSPIPDLLADFSSSGKSTPFLSSASPSESWFGANKYILGAFLVVAIVVAAIVWLR